MSVTVMDEGVPPRTLVGEIVALTKRSGSMVSVLDVVTPLSVTDTVTVRVLATALVLMVKVPVDPVTVTDAGQVTTGSEQVMGNEVGVKSAALVVIVAVTVLGSTAEVALSVSAETTGGFTVSVAVRVTAGLPTVAGEATAIVTWRETGTTAVCTVNVAVLPFTTTVAGTVADVGSLLLTVSAKFDDAGMLPSSCTVAVSD